MTYPLSGCAPIAWEVICPHCAEAQGNPYNGSMMWTEADFEKQGATPATCTACETTYRVKKPRMPR